MDTHRSFGKPASVSAGSTESSVVCRACNLRRIELFRPFSGGELDFVADMKREHISLQAGERLDWAARKDAVFTLYEGWAARCHELPNQERQILDFVLPGDTLGLARVVLRESPAHSIQALTPITLCVLDGQRIRALFDEQPALALGMLSARLQEQERADQRITLLGRMNASERVGYLLLELRERLRQRNLIEGKWFPLPLQRNDLADAVGLSKVHVMRALRDLRERKLAEFHGRQLLIPDVRKLAAFCGYRVARTTQQCAIL